MESFQDSIEKMLWPEKRDRDAVLGDKIPGKIDRTTTRSFLRISSGYIPDKLKKLLPWGERLFPYIFSEGGVEIGPIPAGTPVGLLANLNLMPDNPSLGERIEHDKKLLALALKLKHDLKALPRDAGDEEARKVLANLVNPLMELSKCPDYVVNRGHYFGTGYLPGIPGLSDGDKSALIEFLKTF
jgi:hypothetical protein